MFAGIDSHKGSLAVAIVDDTGRLQSQFQTDNNSQGHDQLAKTITNAGVLRVGIEGSGGERSRRPARGKTDPGDALAIARIAAREAQLPAARCQDGTFEDLWLLTDYRRQLVNERSRLGNRVHADLVALSPGYQVKLPRLVGPKALTAALRLLRGQDSVHAHLTRRRIARLKALDAEIAECTKDVTARVTATGTALLDLPGVGPLTAAQLLGETGDARRYRNRNAFAAATGTSPIPVSSGMNTRHRLNRGGNRRLNQALHTVALTQSRGVGPGKAYLDRRRAEPSRRPNPTRSHAMPQATPRRRRLSHDDQLPPQAHQPLNIGAHPPASQGYNRVRQQVGWATREEGARRAERTVRPRCSVR
jgi:transposase